MTSLKFRSIIFLLFGSLFFAGCKQIENKSGEVAFADIDDAYFLGTVQEDRLSWESNNLVKITSADLDSKLEMVGFLDEEGEYLDEAFTEVYVRQVIPLTPAYSILWGEFKFELAGGSTHSNGLLLHHERGAIYDLGSQYVPHHLNAYMDSRFHQTDRDGRIYFVGEGIRRLHFNQGSDVSVEQYMDYSVNDEHYYFVDQDGNIYFDLGRKVKKASGGIEETGSSFIGFNGFDGKAYGLQVDLSDDMYLFELLVEGGSFRKEISAGLDIYLESYYWELKYYPDQLNGCHLFMAPNLMRGYGEEIVAYGFLYEESEKKFYDFQLPEGFPVNIGGFGIEDHYYWVFDREDQSRIYAIDLDSYTLDQQIGEAIFTEVSEFTLPGNLEVQTLFFNANKNIEFRCYDLNMEKWVKGYLSMERGLEYWDEESSLGSTVLTRIN